MTTEAPGEFTRLDPAAALRHVVPGRECGTCTLCCKVIALRHRFWSVVTGAEIPLTCQIGGGLLVPHPNGIVIHPDARIGVNCLNFHQVTLGSRGRGGVPEIAGHVDIGAGAKILGPVKIGSHARIGPTRS